VDWVRIELLNHQQSVEYKSTTAKTSWLAYTATYSKDRLIGAYSTGLTTPSRRRQSATFVYWYSDCVGAKRLHREKNEIPMTVTDWRAIPTLMEPTWLMARPIPTLRTSPYLDWRIFQREKVSGSNNKGTMSSSTMLLPPAFLFNVNARNFGNNNILFYWPFSLIRLWIIFLNN